MKKFDSLTLRMNLIQLLEIGNWSKTAENSVTPIQDAQILTTLNFTICQALASEDRGTNAANNLGISYN